MSEAKPTSHFFLASVATWCSTGPDRTLTEAIKLMESEKLSFQIFYVPLPPGAEYKIAFYCPQVEGAEMVEFVEFKNGRRVKRS